VKKKNVKSEVSEILSHVRPTPTVTNNLSNEEKIKRITKNFTEIMEVLGLDLSNYAKKVP
jgi:hypothetical protein